MSDLILDSLEIQGFRAFRHLTIEKLGRVNLIVGKNNVGKTTLLEALKIYAAQGSPPLLLESLHERQETWTFSPQIASNSTNAEPAFDLRYLFYGRPDLKKEQPVIQIGTREEPQQVCVKIEWESASAPNTNGHRKVRPTEPPIAYLVVEFPEGKTSYPLHSLFRDLSRSVNQGLSVQIRYRFVKSKGWQSEEINFLWDSIALTNLEQDVLAALHIIAPDIERIGLVARLEDASRVPIVKMRKLEMPVPLASLGEGMNRLFGLSLALVNSENGLLLVDEIETGLHYSVQPDMWRLIFETAKRLNVQVFATTHSYDCVRAFEQVALQHPEEGVIVRLYRDKNGDVKQTLYDESDLEVVAAQDIEVR